MNTPTLVIPTAQHYLDTIAYPCDKERVDFRLETDYGLSEPTEHTHTYHAIVDIVYDKLGRPYSVKVSFLGEEIEPEEEIPTWVESKEASSEGHPENERNEARIAALFGIKKYG